MPERRARTRRQRVEEREQAIVSAAHEIFSKNGFDRAKIAAIAKRAGVAEGTVYLYFENKNALLLAVLAAFYQRLTGTAAEGIKDIPDTKRRLAFLARHHLESVLREWQILMLAMAHYRSAGEYESTEQYQFNRAYVAIFDEVIREGIIRGDIRGDVPLSLLRDIFYGALEYAVRTIHLRTSRAKVDTGEVIESFMRILTDGMFARPEAPPGGIEIAGPNAGPLESVTKRLEKVARKLEAMPGR